jgi:hypothetical protein
MMLELSVALLAGIAFWALDLYTNACDRLS